MPTYSPPRKNAEYVFYVSLVDQANTKTFAASPILATGDVAVAIDDGAPANLATLPVVDADFSKRIKVSLSAAEMNGDRISVIFSDQAGDAWCDLTVDIATASAQFDDLATAAGLSGLSIPSAGDIATAVWASAERSLTTFGTLVADTAAAVWAAVTRTLTDSAGGGATAQDVWEYTPRTLTMTAAQVQAMVDGDDLLIVTAVTFEATLTGLAFPAAWTRIYWTAKQTPGSADATATVQIVVSEPGAAGDGLTVLAQEPASDPAFGSLVVAGDALEITLHDDATTVLRQGTYAYDVKALLGDGTSVLLAAGSVRVVHTPTEAIQA